MSTGWLAGQIRQAVVLNLRENLGRPVALGAVEGDLLHGIDLRDLVIAARGGFSQGVVFSADRIQLRFDLRKLAVHRGDVLQSITQADLWTPHLEVARDAAGAWNLADLLSPGRGPLGPRFHGRIVVHDGSVTYADSFEVEAPPFAARFSRVAGSIDFGQAHRVPLALSGRSADGEDATVEGRYLPDEGTYDLDITAQNGAVRHWGGYLLRLSEIRWEGGRFGGRVHILVTPSRGGLIVDYTGSLRLTDAEAVYLPTHLWLQHLSGAVALDADHASTSGLTLTANGSSLWVRGDVAYPGETWLDLAISSPGLDLSMVRALFFPEARLGLAGRASGDVWITGPASAPYLDGDITSASGRLNRQAFDALHTRFQYSGGTLALSALSARVAGGRIAGDAVLDVSGATASYQFAGAAENIDVRALPAAGLPVTDGLIGRATGEVAGVGTGGRVRVMASLAVGSGSVRGQAFRDLRALFWDDDGAVDLDFLRAGVGATVVYASGRVAKSGALDLGVTAADLPLDQLGARLSVGSFDLGGTADFDGRLAGTEAAPVVSGAVTAWDGRVGPVSFALARGDLTVSPEGIASQHLSLVDGATTYEVSGGLRFRPLAAVNLHVDAAGVQAASLVRGAGGPPALTGTLTAHLSLDGPLAHPSGAGQITLVGGTVGGQRVDRIDAGFAGNGRLVRLISLDAVQDESRLHASGTVDLAGPLDVSISADHIRVADLSSTLGLALSPRGTLALSGAVRGTLQAPELAGTLRVPDLVIDGETFDASGAIDYRAGLLQVSPLTLTQGDASYSLSGQLRLGPHPSADLALDITNGRIATIVAAGGISLPVPVAGTIDGRIALTGPLADPSAGLSLSMRDARVSGRPMGTGIADLTLSHGSVDIRRLELSPGQGRIAAEGRIVLNGTSAVEVSGTDLDPDVLRPFLRLDRQLVGKMNFTIQWSGPTRSPTAGLSLEATDAGVPGATADRIIGLAYYKDGVIHIEDGQISKGPHKVVVQGTLPVAPAALALDPAGPIRLDLHLEDADLSLLSLLSPRIHDAAGTVEGQVSIGGTVAAPQMSGYVRSTGGRFRIDPLATPFEDVSVDIAFSQDEILVRDLSAALGGGQVHADGTIAVSSFRPGKVALGLTAQHVTVTIAGLYDGGVDAALALAGPAERPVLSGTVALSHGRVAVAGELAAPRGGAPPVGLDVNVVAGDDVEFNQGAVRAQLAGAVHAGGTLNRPALSGTIRSVQGTIDLLGATFQVTEGTVTFSEALGLEPQVSARAQATYGETRVFMDINGVVPNLTLTWSAEPPMSQGDIMALVLGTSGPTGVGQEVGRLLLGSFGQAIQRALHLDTFTISYGAQNPVTLRIGKYIVRNLFLAFSEVFPRATAPGATTAIPAPGPGTLTPVNYTGQAYTVLSLEYYLSPNVFLTYDVDTLGDNGVFLLTRFPF